jgi:hypothetical protein
MDWEETHLSSLLTQSATGGLSGTVLVRQHHEQRCRILACLTELENPRASSESMAGECLEIIRWLEVDMEDEEREVLRSTANLD